MVDYLAITGGVGGAKLGLGLARILDRSRLAFAVNTGDDFEHLGWHISPDIDTLLYTLSCRANISQGWGLEGESWHVMEALAELGLDDSRADEIGELALLDPSAGGNARQLSGAQYAALYRAALSGSFEALAGQG